MYETKIYRQISFQIEYETKFGQSLAVMCSYPNSGKLGYGYNF